MLAATYNLHRIKQKIEAISSHLTMLFLDNHVKLNDENCPTEKQWHAGAD